MDYFQTGAEVIVEPRWLGAEVTRGRGGSGAEVSELQFKHGGSFDQEDVISVGSPSVNLMGMNSTF